MLGTLRRVQVALTLVVKDLAQGVEEAETLFSSGNGIQSDSAEDPVKHDDINQ